MPPISDIRHVYDPGILRIMTSAFDKAWRHLPGRRQSSPGARRRLSLVIMRRVDPGEVDAGHLVDVALIDFLK